MHLYLFQGNRRKETAVFNRCQRRLDSNWGRLLDCFTNCATTTAQWRDYLETKLSVS
jgi:hypothetical protein